MQFLFSLLLVTFPLLASSSIKFSEEFLFGVASAPGHVEDSLDDTWLEFAQQNKIRAFHNVPSPEKRLEFWTQPEKEIKEAKELGIQIYRLGIDWGRVQVGPSEFDEEALRHYKKIITKIRSHKMKVMLTLFHFTVPKWLEKEGGWKSDKAKEAFLQFSKKAVLEFHPLVDFWITFNEPQIFSTMAYVMGVFPPGEKNSLYTHFKVLKRMGETHNELYQWIKKNYPEALVGISQHMGVHTGKNVITKFLSRFTGEFMNWYFPKLIKGNMDFFGFNYYGAEWIGLTGVEIAEDEEYSEAGRAIHPQGLYEIMKEIKKRYSHLPQFITENGVSDSTDWLRSSYLIEHLLAVSEAQKKGVDVLGYIFWTMTDNMEWADGYCPKFGLVEVDRTTMKRIRRPSFFLFQSIIHSREITQKQRENSWDLVVSHQGKERPFCRAQDGVSGLDSPSLRSVKIKDWRFKPEKLLIPAP